ncbi:MAG: phage portal protein [Ruminococcaceae bacterium]|nr:phage portal protein [Oscillospiraceae bacterium]
MTEFEVGNVLMVRSIEKALGREIPVSGAMSTAMSLWRQLYKNQVPWAGEGIKSLNLAAMIAGELACQATLDFHSTISGSQRADMLNKQVYQDVIFDIRRWTEYACAVGGVVFKPYLDKNRLAVEYVSAERFFPLAVDSRGEIVSAVFLDRIKRDGKVYSRLEEHILDEKGVTVRNLAFSDGGFWGLGKPVSLSAVKEWSGLAEQVTIPGLTTPLFSYFKMPMANAVEPGSPLGVSVYARATGLLEEADRQFSRLLWEYEGGELAIDASVDAIMLENGDMKMPALNKRLFRALNLDAGDSDLYNIYAPTLRDGAYLDGLNEILVHIEDICGLARGTISNANRSARTATELKILRQRSYATVTDIQKSLQRALKNLVVGLDKLATVFALLPVGKYELTFEFDDSTVTDRSTQFAEMQALVEQGVLHKWELRTWYLGETEEQAKRKLAEQEQPEAGKNPAV